MAAGLCRGARGLRSWIALTTVSYTHLDVYKRQVPDYTGNVYGRAPVLEFHKYLCPVRKFGSMDELATLIHHAAEESKAYFAAQH